MPQIGSKKTEHAMSLDSVEQRVHRLSSALQDVELLRAVHNFSNRFNEDPNSTPLQFCDEDIEFYSSRIAQGLRIHVLEPIKTNAANAERVVSGVLWSRDTAALSNKFLSDLLTKSRTSHPLNLYNDMIATLPRAHSQVVTREDGLVLHVDVDGDLRFQFDYYDAFIDLDSTVGAVDVSKLKPSAGFLSLVEVGPQQIGKGLSKILVEDALKTYRERGFQYVFAFGRLPEMNKSYPDSISAAADIQNYILRKREDGLHPDYGIRFHQKAGGQVICGIPWCALDEDSHHHGFMVIYDLETA